MPDPIPTPTIYSHPCIDVQWKPKQPSEMRRVLRIKGPIYEAILKEFYEDGCHLAARHFQYLVQLERSLIEKKQEIHYVYENADFLITLVENVKAAEQIFLLDKSHGIYVSRKILNQILMLAEREKFEWLTQSLYTIIAKYMLEPKTNDHLAMEQSTRFIFKYAKFLLQQGKSEQLQEATIIIPIAMEAACGENWKPDTSPEDEFFSTLHAALGNLLAKIYLIKAKEAGITRKHAMKRAQKALKAIAQVGIKENKSLAFKAFLTKIEILMDADRYDWALKELGLLEESVMKAKGPEFIQYKLDLLKNIGISLHNLGQPAEAIEMFGKALNICKTNNYSQAEGDILLQIGHAQRRLPGGAVRSRLAFQLAKIHFERQGDRSKVFNTKYLLAALKSDHIQDDLRKLINSSAYCDYFKLRCWKNRCEPFWEVEKQAGHINQGVLYNILMHKSEKLRKLYNLVLNATMKVKDKNKGGDVKAANSVESYSLERTFVKTVIHSDISIPGPAVEIEAEAEAVAEAEEELYEYEYELNSESSDFRGIEQSDTSQKTPHVTLSANVRRYSSYGSGSKRSSPKYIWIVKDSDPISCLLREI